MKPAALFAMTYLSVTQLETRHRLVSAELGRERAAAEARRVERPRSARRLFRAVRGAAAA
jgi:hypothetical protein